ncbi:hypothetical protein L7834_010550 [Providencia rettgeri]|uniref:hypothetical protein n=1 Tax=Providencia rettgeri TaxID=587 RepID=UPI001EE74E3F|nr:hypothetical protein [Providencia rettgeri]MCG5370120.1 hypothetical protein [Providencia rettgeri]
MVIVAIKGLIFFVVISSLSAVFAWLVAGREVPLKTSMKWTYSAYAGVTIIAGVTIGLLNLLFR